MGVLGAKLQESRKRAGKGGGEGQLFAVFPWLMTLQLANRAPMEMHHGKDAQQVSTSTVAIHCMKRMLVDILNRLKQL